MLFTERLNDIAGPGQCRTCALAIANERKLPCGKSYVLVCVRSADCTAQIRVTDEVQIHLVYIAPKDLPRAYALCASVGVASVGHERTKGESRGLFARCERTTAAAAAVNELLSPLWKASIAYIPLCHSSPAYEPAATVGAASVGHERTKGESRDQRTRDMRGIAEIAEFADQGAGN